MIASAHLAQPEPSYARLGAKMLLPEERPPPRLAARTRSSSAIGVGSCDGRSMMIRSGSFNIGPRLCRDDTFLPECTVPLLPAASGERERERERASAAPTRSLRFSFPSAANGEFSPNSAAENADPNAAAESRLSQRKAQRHAPIVSSSEALGVSRACSCSEDVDDVESRSLEIQSDAAATVPPPPPPTETSTSESLREGLLAEEPEACFICLMEFSDGGAGEEDRMILPCSAQCNTSPVHAKCIYEWKQRRENPKGVGTCPLCREPLVEDAFTPLDLLESAKFVMWAERKAFVSKPLPPSNDPVRCFVRVVHSVWTGLPVMYECYLQAPSTLAYPLGPLPGAHSPLPGDQLLLSARKKWTGVGSSKFHISLDRSCKDYDARSPNHVAAVSR